MARDRNISEIARFRRHYHYLRCIEMDLAYNNLCMLMKWRMRISVMKPECRSFNLSGGDMIAYKAIVEDVFVTFRGRQRLFVSH